MKVYDNIYFLIKHRGVSIGKLERSIGVSLGYLSRSKKVNADISAETLYRISKFFDVTMDELYTGSFRADAIKEELERLRKELAELEQNKHS